MDDYESVWKSLGTVLTGGLLILLINLAVLAGAVWIVVKVLQWTGVL